MRRDAMVVVASLKKAEQQSASPATRVASEDGGREANLPGGFPSNGDIALDEYARMQRERLIPRTQWTALNGVKLADEGGRRP